MKRLVILADGTWMTVRNRTNVWRLEQAIPKRASDGTHQVVCYHEGVGNRPGLRRLLGGAFGTGLSDEVMRCYQTVVEEYQDGDELYFFGYSRGAYTVRSTAGLINRLGVLRPEHADLVPEAHEHYRDSAAEWKPLGERAQAFRARFSRPSARITCMGVWDTVGSLGVPTMGPIGHWSRKRHQFHDVRLGGIVANAFQALAIDEHRRPFEPAVWEGADLHHAAGQRLEQVWFPGSHVNVGGGSADTGLSDTALQWMVERARTCGLEIDAGRLAAKPRFDADLCDSYSRFFRGWDWVKGASRFDRPIGRGPRVDETDGDTYRTYESVAASARQRVDAPRVRPTYRPSNLLAYLNQVDLSPAGST